MPSEVPIAPTSSTIAANEFIAFLGVDVPALGSLVCLGDLTALGRDAHTAIAQATR